MSDLQLKVTETLNVLENNCYKVVHSIRSAKISKYLTPPCFLAEFFTYLTTQN